MGRAIVRDPQVFLFDEPLSNLDAKLRVQMRTEIKELHQRLKTTSVYVTHDQIEAMTMADRIVVMQLTAMSSRSALRSTSTTGRPTCSSPASSARPAMNFIDAHDQAQQRRGGGRDRRTARSCRCRRHAGRQRRPARRLWRAPRASGAAPDGSGVPAEVVGGRADRCRDAGRQPARRHRGQAVFRERYQVGPGDRIGFAPRSSTCTSSTRSSGTRLNA